MNTTTTNLSNVNWSNITITDPMGSAPMITIPYNDVLNLFGDKIMSIVLISGLLFTFQSLLLFFCEDSRFCRDLNDFVSGMGLVAGMYLLALGIIWKMGLNV